MSVSCGSPASMDGGVITNATISSSSIQGSVINGSVISASSLEKLTEVDTASALVIANALAALSPEQLNALAKALGVPTQSSLELAAVPPRNSATDLPTELVGERNYLLGAPSGWLDMQGVAIPAYTTRS